MPDNLTPIERFWSKVNKDGPVPAHRPELGACWSWNGPQDDRGYGRFGSQKATRVAWELAEGDPVPDDKIICHACDNPNCVRNDSDGFYIINGRCLPRRGHIYVGTDALNSLDKVMKGRTNPVFGEKHWQVKVTKKQVGEIRRLAKRGLLQREIAERYGVNRATVSKIIRLKLRAAG